MKHSVTVPYPMVVLVRMVKGRQHNAQIRCPNRRDGVSRPRK
jgi:hypothetical protein